MKERIPIPTELADRVLFASDRQCCICRTAEARVIIHHIDEDPSNNSIENLAVLCLDHHSVAHSTEAYVRNLSPGLISLYNRTWRAFVQLRLNPAIGSPDVVEYQSEVLLEMGLACHTWRALFFHLHAPELTVPQEAGPPGMWEALLRASPSCFSQETWEHNKPLFVEGLDRLVADFDRLSSGHGQMLPPACKTAIMRARRRVRGNQWLYAYLPEVFTQLVNPDDEGFHSMFRRQFREVIETLSQLATLAEDEQDRLNAS